MWEMIENFIFAYFIEPFGETMDVHGMKKLVSISLVLLMIASGMPALVNGGGGQQNTYSESENGHNSPNILVPSFSDDMENGTNGWNATGFWHIVTNESGAPSWNISHSGTHSWWYGIDSTGNYDNGSRNYGNLVSPSIHIENYPAFLHFWSYYETENQSGYDVKKIKISLDNGSYQDIDTLGSNSGNSWNEHLYNITPYIPVRYGYELPWSKKGTVVSPTLSEESDRVIKPAVIKDNGTYRMWYTGRATSTSPYKIFYATSQDGYSWDKKGVVLSPTGDETSVYFCSVINDSGTYKMWYVAKNDTSTSIRYAESIDGMNWTKKGVVISPTAGGWDASNVDGGWILKENSTYKMWYAGNDGVNITHICYATSLDGINWTKKGVVLDGGGSYESKALKYPSVVRMPDGIYRMWYTAYNDDGASNHYRIKSAYSKNGINWTEGDVEINFGSSSDPDGAGYSSVLLDGNKLKMWYTGINWNGPEVIDLATTDVTHTRDPHNIKVMFSFDTVDAASNDFQGWYIDDFSIEHPVPPVVGETHPSDGENRVFPDAPVRIVFDHSMNTSHIPVLEQTAGDSVSYTFEGWESTYRENDTAVWIHDNWTEGTSVYLKVSDYQDIGGDTGDAYSWSFDVGILYSVSISPDSGKKFEVPGGAVEYNLSIENTGMLNDTYSLDISGAEWNTEILDANGNPISSIYLKNGSSENMIVRVEVPSDAGQYDSDEIEVNAVSQNRSSVSASSTLNTTTPLETTFFDDTENGKGYWTRDGSWELGVPSSGPSSAFSGDSCWGTNLNGYYPNYAYDSLLSPEIYLPDEGTSWLYVEMWYSLESGYDYGRLQIRENGASSWTTLSSYNGNSGGWVQKGFDLSGYSGKIVQIRFLLDSDSYVTYPGWYLDNIYIGVKPKPPEVRNVYVDGMSEYTVELGTAINLTAVIDESTGDGRNISGADYLTNHSSTIHEMYPSDGSFDSPTESVYSVVNTSTLGAGDYEIYVDGWDYIPAYNRSHVSYATLHIVDTTPPEISLYSPHNDAYTENTTPLIYANMVDYSSINTSSIKFYINGFSVDYTINSINRGYNISYQQENELSPGEVIECRIVAEDIYGNRLDWSWNFTINGPVHVSVHKGWNLVTLPWITSPENISTALSGLQWDRASVYVNGEWYTYNRNRDAKFNVGFPTVDSTMGIWVECTSNGTINGTNHSPGTTDIVLHRGWNLVGFPSSHDAKVSDVLSGINWSLIKGADASGNQYSLSGSDYLRVGRAYWIRVDEDCTWSVEW